MKNNVIRIIYVHPMPYGCLYVYTKLEVKMECLAYFCASELKPHCSIIDIKVKARNVHHLK